MKHHTLSRRVTKDPRKLLFHLPSTDVDCGIVTTPADGCSVINNEPTVGHEMPYPAAEMPHGITSAPVKTVGNACCAEITTVVASTSAQEQSDRRRVDEIVEAFKLRHLRHRTYLSRRTGQVVEEIQRS